MLTQYAQIYLYRCDPQVGVSRDVTPWQSCAPLGLLVAAVQYEVVRVEISPLGTPLLLLGQADIDVIPRGPRDRPSSFQPPLVRCAGELPPSSHFLKPPSTPPYYSGTRPTAASSLRTAVLLLLALLYGRLT